MSKEKKINLFTETVLISEIVNQAKFAEKAASRLFNTTDSIEVWESIQSILVATANVSKILWPGKKYVARGKQLRERLGVNDDNLLSKRIFRNHFEHYDERIEEWIESNKSAVYTDSMINPFEPTLLGYTLFCHRGYNPTSKMLSFRGESFDLVAVLAELTTIRENCQFFILS